MGEKLVIGPISKGLRNDVTPFNIDNDSFPTLVNAYQWRQRIKRKRGTAPLTRLQRHFESLLTVYNTGNTTILLNGAGEGNILTGFTMIAGQTNSSLVPGSVILTASGGPTIFTDPTQDGFLTPTGTGGPNTINYATGEIVIPSQAGNTVSAVFNYYPGLPVMGLEELNLDATQFPLCLGFDTIYSYNIPIAFPYTSYDVSFYKNPPASANLPGYVPKTTVTPTTWNGQDYQQFWTVNYEGALWATNGINVPFSITNVGMQFAPATDITYIANTATTLDVTIVGSPLVVGDWVFLNEWTGANADTLNFLTGFVTVAAPPNYTITFVGSAIGAGPFTPGIIQYLTNRSDLTKDVLRWYDGDPTDGNATTPTLNGNEGWVNFAPPLSRAPFSISGLPEAQYYLIGARMIVPFKDRLLFFGCVVQTSGTDSQIYLPDTVIYSQNGTPYYTATFDADPSLPTTVFNPMLVPINRVAVPGSFWSDQTGFGGFLQAGTNDPIITTGTNRDVIITGFSSFQTKLVYSGNDIIPFNFFLINTELGSSSTFSGINMDSGVITRGSRGFVITSDNQTIRIDLEIPDEVFQINLTENGSERFCSQRDFINEWIYFTYPVNSDPIDDGLNKFPNQTLLYNYREGTWGLFKENYTTYGSFQKQTGFTWQTVGLIFPSWQDWNEPWNAGSSTLLQPLVIGGNQQGFVLSRDEGTGEANSLFIKSFLGNTVTSLSHSLNENDYIIVNGALGDVSQDVNGRVFRIFNVTEDTFDLDPNIVAGPYFGGAFIKRIYVPFIQTKQFPMAWGMGRKTRIGMQQYLFSSTDNSQIQLLIFLSQNNSSPYNAGGIVPALNTVNPSLIYSTVLYTSPESENIGLTPANTNLQMPTAVQQAQIWHRINTSLIGDTVQLGFTLSDEQIRELLILQVPRAITAATQTDPCILDVVGEFDVGNFVTITDVEGMVQLNDNTYQIIAETDTQITIDVNATGFDAYISGGFATEKAFNNNFAEIELHGFILDLTPSQLLV